MNYADVIVDISHERVDRPFTYRVPESLIGKLTIGSAVIVPFGKGNKLCRAWVIGFPEKTGVGAGRVKEICGTADRDLPAEAVLLRLAAWMRECYGSTMATALKTVLPASRRVKARIHGQKEETDETGPDELSLSREQSNVAETLLSEFDAGVRRTYLLCGITGSGKTEVYIRCIEEMVKRGKQSIVLIPEIALTWQTLRRFTRRFGNRVSVMNSTLSKGERFSHFEQARRGELDVIIGPRSALFTPFPNLGLIVIDEEHEGSYKSENMPKYHARETAEALATLTPGGASVLLGSATPSMEALYRAKTGVYGYFRLTKRLTGATLPSVEIVDLREELRRGNRTPFSASLREKISDRLRAGEQTMLFINRRGMAGFVSCRACGHVFRCPHCDVSLSAHSGRQLVCHYCGYSEEEPHACPRCGSRFVSGFRAGTEAIELQVKKLFPEARTLRMDADTTRTKGSYDRILAAFSRGEADVLVGTQMIVKGHDFPRVTLVGILAADLSLNTGDYRASERTFQLLVQAAGRAGRGSRPGEVVIQTYQPEHYAVQLAATQDIDAFFEAELSYRRLMRYPPAGHLLAIQVFAKGRDEGACYAKRLADRITEAADDMISVIGPAPAMIGRIADVFRFGIYLKCGERRKLVAMKDLAEAILTREREAGGAQGIAIQFDFDPIRGF